MKDLYQNKEYIKNTLLVVKDVIDDLEELSAYNKDIINDEVNVIQSALKVINIKLNNIHNENHETIDTGDEDYSNVVCISCNL